jgi:hypothetical protein
LVGYRLVEKMSTSEGNSENSQESLSNKAKAIVIGIVLAIIGHLISGSFAKETLTNYIGFILLILGMIIFVVGIFATATTSYKTHLNKQTPTNVGAGKTKILFFSVWLIGVGIILAVVGSVLGSAFAKTSMINSMGYQLLLVGCFVSLIGVLGTTLIGIKKAKNRPRRVKQPGATGARFGVMFFNALSIALSTFIVIFGFIMADSYAKESVMNYIGFGTLLAGVTLLSIGIAKTVAGFLKNRLYSSGTNRPRLLLGSVWAMAIGLMLIANGSLIASSYAKNSLMNYSGFGMLLSGTGVFVYGLFETARFSALGYLSGKRSSVNVDLESVKPKEKLSIRLKGFFRNLVKTSAIINLIGVMVSLGLLFFSLWQLDLIVSGPVWWEASPSGQGWYWPGPGAYANDYFQCFFWQTTIGQAYDTLFMLIFISFIVLFASAFFWPRGHAKKEG